MEYDNAIVLSDGKNKFVVCGEGIFINDELILDPKNAEFREEAWSNFYTKVLKEAFDKAFGIGKK